MRLNVTISFVENTDGTAELETCKGFFESLMGHHLPMWCDVDGEINVSVEPVAASSDEATPHSHVADFLKHHGDEYFEAPRGNGYIAWLRKHYGCDDGGAQ